MNQITLSSELRLDVPPYYKCYFPLVDLHLRQSVGQSMLSLLPNAELLSVPVFSVETSDLIPNPVMVGPDRVFREQTNVFELTTTCAPSFEEGLAQLRERIRHGESVIVSGTTYEIPHGPDYHNPNYLMPRTMSDLNGGLGGTGFQITDHYISVIGLESHEVLIYDPVPNQFVGKMSIEAFEKFWRGNIQFEVFTQARGYSLLVTYGIINVTVAAFKDKDIKTLALDVLARVCTAFLEGRTETRRTRRYLSGIALINYVREAFSLHYDAKGEIPSPLGKCFFDIRWSRYYLRDFLNDLNYELHLPFSEAIHEILVLIELWEKIYKMFVTMTRKKSQSSDAQVQNFLGVLDEVIVREMDFHHQFKDLALQLG